MTHLNPETPEAMRSALANALPTVFLAGPPSMAIALVAVRCLNVRGAVSRDRRGPGRRGPDGSRAAHRGESTRRENARPRATEPPASAWRARHPAPAGAYATG